MSRNCADSEHVVFHPQGRDGGFTRVPDLAAAVALVEWLHNERGVVDASVFAMAPVRLAVRSYVRVEVAPPTDGDDYVTQSVTGRFQSATPVGSDDLAAAAEALRASAERSAMSLDRTANTAVAEAAPVAVDPVAVDPVAADPVAVDPVDVVRAAAHEAPPVLAPEPLPAVADEPLTAATILPNQGKPRGLGFFVH